MKTIPRTNTDTITPFPKPGVKRTERGWAGQVIWGKRMKFITLVLIFFICACKQKYTYTDNSGVSQTKVVSRQNYVNNTEIEFHIKEKKECLTGKSFVGFCCKCGWTLDIDYDCSCDIWRNCPEIGHQIVTKSVKQTKANLRFIFSDGTSYIVPGEVITKSQSFEMGRTTCEK